ncbi:hypothetical protein M378DRAFT_719620 [Amanita muscaria Koide BX008]|uniref:Uncharacterized protein n=1 Tax=Amanita muscaria (strain Koide BX008) TaxID=946122 RepID=A0A0C2XLJ1_AMAMK|nr:hypothetical protein M378DRAFT_719620 [Amanita muscaria Koide BX008]
MMDRRQANHERHWLHQTWQVDVLVPRIGIRDPSGAIEPANETKSPDLTMISAQKRRRYLPLNRKTDTSTLLIQIIDPGHADLAVMLLLFGSLLKHNLVVDCIEGLFTVLLQGLAECVVSVLSINKTDVAPASWELTTPVFTAP